jgi:hypothetical protein
MAEPEEGIRNMGAWDGPYVKMDIIQFAGIRLIVYSIVGCLGFEPRDAENDVSETEI